MKSTENSPAFGAPGIQPRWTSSAKTGVGTALSDKSHVWFTLSHGIFNEIYSPRIDKTCIRDMGFIVTDCKDFFSEEKSDTISKIKHLAEGVPAFSLENTCKEGRYRIEKEIVTDPQRDSVLQFARFIPRQGAFTDYSLYVLLAPHLGNLGNGNSAWVGDFEGTPMLFAQREDNCLALACSLPWGKRSAGFVGASDGWQDLKARKQMSWEFTRAENGNVALTAEIDLTKSNGEFVLSLGFGKTTDEAARNAVGSLRDGFKKAKLEYIAGWEEWLKQCKSVKPSGPGDLSLISIAVLRTHESKTFPGGLIASLSFPWGASQGDADQGGYHLVWGRDMVETVGGLLAAGAHQEVHRALSYLQKTQLADGHWPQNMWLDGSAYWNGIQMDETALPILLVDLASREKVLAEKDLAELWPMMKKAVGYLARNGPVSPQDRWEEDPGYTPFTVGAQIAALLAAADFADLNHEKLIGEYLREIADVWRDSIDRWMYASNTDWCKRFNVEGYYVRIAPQDNGQEGARFESRVHVKNVVAAEDSRSAKYLVSPDALDLVRFGVRAANDPRMRDTATVVDALLKTETPTGPVWHRYNDDGYGEHEDGAPFDGTGIGRGWPLLTGERAHYELAAGRGDVAKHLLVTMESFANEGGLIPEQVWDSPDIPSLQLHFGRPSGSAMPLVWAHAEYLKLQRSLRDGKVFDLPPQTVQRYLIDKIVSPRMVWRFNHKIRWMPVGKKLRIETLVPAIIHWSGDSWRTVKEVKTYDVGLGVHMADLFTESFPIGTQIEFTFFWLESKNWEGSNFNVRLGSL